MHSDEKGFLLVDVIVATALMVLAITALGKCFITSLRTSEYISTSLVATYLAAEKLEQLKSAAMSSELHNSDEILSHNNQRFERYTRVSIHPAYPSLSVVTVTVSWQGQSSSQSICNATYILNSDNVLHL